MNNDPLAFLDSSESSDSLSFLDESQPSRTRSLLSALPKGAIKSAQSFKEQGSLRFSGAVPTKLGMEMVEKFLPTQKGETAEDILEFTGENLPLLAMGGEGGLIKKGTQAVTGALAKKGAKEFNLPEWAQDIVGAVGMNAPGAVKEGISKKLMASNKQKSIVDFLTSKGLTEKEITPIIQDPKKLSWLSKAASKFEKKSPWIKGIKEKIGGIFEDIRERGAKAGYLKGDALYEFEDAFHKKMEKVPRMYRGLIKKEVDDLFQNPIDFKELHDFDKALNAIVGNVEGGKAAVGILKEPIKSTMKKMNPSLFSELEQTNHAYSRISDFSDKMTKKNWEGLVHLGVLGKTLLGTLTLNPVMAAGGLKTAALAWATRQGLKQVLTNPRLQNVHKKMWQSVLKNDIPTALKLMKVFNQESQKKEQE